MFRCRSASSARNRGERRCGRGQGPDVLCAAPEGRYDLCWVGFRVLEAGLVRFRCLRSGLSRPKFPVCGRILSVGELPSHGFRQDSRRDRSGTLVQLLTMQMARHRRAVSFRKNRRPNAKNAPVRFTNSTVAAAISFSSPLVIVVGIMQNTGNPCIRVASKLTKLASVRAELHLCKEEAGRWQNLNASRCQFFRRRAGRLRLVVEFEFCGTLQAPKNMAGGGVDLARALIGCPPCYHSYIRLL